MNIYRLKGPRVSMKSSWTQKALKWTMKQQRHCGQDEKKKNRRFETWEKGMNPLEEKVIPTTCSQHCGGVCHLKVHVREGVITRIETDDGEEPQLRACLKGRAMRQRVYAPDRLKYPLRRTGKRGEGKFERISWDEALD